MKRVDIKSYHLLINKLMKAFSIIESLIAMLITGITFSCFIVLLTYVTPDRILMKQQIRNELFSTVYAGDSARGRLFISSRQVYGNTYNKYYIDSAKGSAPFITKFVKQ